jgi:hypothetical protein
LNQPTTNFASTLIGPEPSFSTTDKLDFSDVPGVHGLADLKISAVGANTQIVHDGDSIMLLNFNPSGLHDWNLVF